MQTKKDCLLLQLKYIKNKQQTIVNREFQNLKKFILLVKKLVFELFFESLIDIVLEQIVFPNIIEKQLFILLISFNRIAANSVDNISNS